MPRKLSRLNKNTDKTKKIMKINLMNCPVKKIKSTIKMSKFYWTSNLSKKK